jgi:hypothetical protein
MRKTYRCPTCKEDITNQLLKYGVGLVDAFTYHVTIGDYCEKCDKPVNINFRDNGKVFLTKS